MKILKEHTTLILLLVLFFNSCAQNKNTIEKENLIGNWALSKEESIEFTITNNKFKDFEHLYDYDYVLNKNKLVVKDSTYVVTTYTIKKISKDSLFLVTQNNILLKYYKRGKLKD